MQGLLFAIYLLFCARTLALDLLVSFFQNLMLRFFKFCFIGLIKKWAWLTKSFRFCCGSLILIGTLFEANLTCVRIHFTFYHCLLLLLSLKGGSMQIQMQMVYISCLILFDFLSSFSEML